MFGNTKLIARRSTSTSWLARYLAAIEKVTAAVDEALDSDASGQA